MKFFSITTLALTLFTANAFSAIEPQSTTSISNFELNRTNKNVNLALKAGLITGGISGSGIDAAYYLNPNLLVGFEYLQGDEDLRDKAASSIYSNVDKAKISSKFYGVYGKYFTGSTFALTGGLYQRSIDAKIKISSSLDKNYYLSTSSTGSATVAKFGLGNYWSWNFGLTLGCEWVGVQMPVGNKKDRSSLDYGSSVSKSTAQEDLELVDDLSKTFSSSTTYSLLNLHLGYNF